MKKKKTIVRDYVSPLLRRLSSAANRCSAPLTLGTNKAVKVILIILLRKKNYLDKSL